MLIEEAILELQVLIQQFDVARPRVPQGQRSDYDKRIRKLRAELVRLESYDPDIDPESPEEMAQQALAVAGRLRAFLPDVQEVETLTFDAPRFGPSQASMQANWDGTRWALTPQRLTVHAAQALAGHLKGRVCQTNDLDVWRASFLPADFQQSMRVLSGAQVTLGEAL